MSQNKILKINQTQSMRLSENLRTLLKNRRESESNVAQRLGLPLMTIRRLVSGETSDPRISTLKLIAHYFNLSIDALIGGNNVTSIDLIGKNKPHFVPILDWIIAGRISSVKEIDLTSWEAWQPITLGGHCTVSDQAFALESRPSMRPRFPQGTIFIIDPLITPTDSDIVLIRVKKNDELSLRELVIDPPEWHLHGVTTGSQALIYSHKEYEIAGVVVLTMLYNRK